MTEAKKANRSATPITSGIGGLLLGGVIFSIGTATGAVIAVILGVIGALAGLVALLAGVYQLVENLDSATQALLDRS